MLYIPLYIKTEYSLLDSMIKIKDLVKFAKDNGYKALTITDNNLFGAYEFYLECIKNNILPIIGLEVEVDNDIIILYAKNNNGYKNLIKINENEKTFDLLKHYSDDLICILPFNLKEKYNFYEKIYNDIFIGYKSNNEKEKLNIKNRIYMNKILYLEKKDKIYYLYLNGIKNDKTIKEININSDNYLNIDINNMELENYNYIYNNCKVKIEKQDDLLPKYDVPQNYDEYTYLREMCRVGLKKRFGDKVKAIYIERIKYELEMIKSMGFCNYFLVVMDYVRFARLNNILVGPGRGSAAGSLVAYVLFITDVDPIKYNLLFERFLNPNRVTMPDIDIDFEYDRREEVINYCIKKYSKKKVAGIVTFTTLASRQVLRDVSKVMDLDQNMVDAFVKLIDSKKTLKENMDNIKVKELLNRKELNELYQISIRLEGLKRHASIHAAGIIISNRELDEVIPIVYHDNMYFTCFTSNYLEQLGLLKMDFLALKNLSLITSTISNMKSDGIEINFNEIPLNDSKTFDIFKNANTVGIFQFDSEGIKNFLKKLKPNNLEELSIALALYRPGPMANIDSFIRRKNGYEKIDYIDESLKEILLPTYGIIIYQEQIMKISNVMAGFSLGEADILRRAMSKKKESILLDLKEKFIKGSIDNGYKVETASKVYDLILKFASYGFNRSHSVAYAIISYKMAYLKAHYNKYFMKNLLDNVAGTISTKEYIYEAKMNDITILNPDINLSSNKYVVESNGLRFPLNGIRNVGYNSINKILEERENGIFNDIFDFICRTYSNGINKKTIISLIDAGCFDSFNINHKTLIENLDIIVNYNELYKQLGSDTEKPILTGYNEFDEKELINRSFEVFGFYLNNHPLTNIKMKNKNYISLNNIENYFDKFVDTVLIVDKIKIIDTKNNKKMCFITASDELSSIDLVIFPNIIDRLDNIKVSDIIMVRGRVEKRFDKYQIVVNEIRKWF